MVWAEKASESGNEFAQYILGRMLEEGCAVEKDMQRAAQLYCQC